jgi:hypothetical protein
MASLSRKDKHGLVLIGAVLAALLALFAVNYQLSNKPKADERNCIVPVTDKTVILIDRSDDTPTQTLDEIVARIKDYVATRAAQNELISIFEITPTSRTRLSPVFSSCLPQKDGNDLYQNRRAIQKFFEERFEAPLDAALAKPPSRSNTSPISEVITDLAASEHLNAAHSRLMVFSDLMQNSDNTSLYGCTSSSDAIAHFRQKRAGAIERPTFKNTSVELHVIPREGIGEATVACRNGFWAWFFGDNEGDGAGLELKPLPGGARVK